MPEWFFYVVLLLLGLVLGSFANVVIWRLPRGESLMSPGSRCPACGTPVRWHDNIPVISWFALRGRCRSCGERISRRYPAVELLSGALWLAAALAFGVDVRALVAGLFFWTLLVLTFIDLDTMRLPNPIVGALAAFGLIGAAASHLAAEEWVPLTGAQASPLLVSGIGALLGAGLSAGIAAVYAGIRGKSGFGMGDVKLLGAMGLFLGPYVLLALMAGSLLGTFASVAVAARKGASSMSERMPFGPFLAVGGIATALGGPALWAAYLVWIGVS